MSVTVAVLTYQSHRSMKFNTNEVQYTMNQKELIKYKNNNMIIGNSKFCAMIVEGALCMYLIVFFEWLASWAMKYSVRRNLQ